MFKFIRSLLDDNAKDINKYQKKVEVINALEPQMQALSDAQLREKTAEFKNRLQNGESLNDLLPEAFAVVREASWRVLDMRHFDVQMIGGMVLHDGRISEMKTGEGKTLVATAPVYLNALTEKGVHVVTVNDYLATRDSQWMGKVYRFLGLSVGLIVHDMEFPQRKAAYAADITYGTNNEVGFDYLRDNMVVEPQNLVQRPLHYAIVDEVDSILIDEARTPLIISGIADKPTDLYYQMAKIVPRLKAEADYTVDEKLHTAALTEEGVSRVETMLGVENLYADDNTQLAHYVNQALKAAALYKKDRDYVVKEGKVIIVDEFTGRLMFGRRYSEGLHQSIEAKENVRIERESQTLATITFQNYFRMYEKLAGMTGTALTEEDEFRKIYGLDVVVVPTHLPMIRKDFPDAIFRSRKGKLKAVAEEIAEVHESGRPILVGTISIEKSEELSHMLKQCGIGHQVLNAKFHEKEAEIIAQAGRLGTVTIATNMAGRGTDIILGGNPEALARQEMQRSGEEYQPEQELDLIEKYRQQTKAEHEQVVALGGLHIIGTERHESRRIDNQLRGRSGRQGDPGSSRFFIAMEDDLMRLFGADNLSSILDRIGMDDSMNIDSPLVSRSIETAQKRVEARHFDTRKTVLDYDDVMNQQREIIYSQRQQALRGADLKEQIEHMLDEVVEATVARFSGVSQYPEDWDLAALGEESKVFLPADIPDAETLKTMTKTEITALYQQKARAFYDAKEERIGSEAMRQMERFVILKVVDAKWMDHLDAMDQLRQGIGLRAYAQKDPLVEYKYEAYDMFQAMIADIQTEVIRFVFRLEIAEAPKEQAKVTEVHGGEEALPGAKKPTVKDKSKEVGRNEPCPCGSGKKYKKCCGKDL